MFLFTDINNNKVQIFHCQYWLFQREGEDWEQQKVAVLGLPGGAVV
jgi:hypothetical protein